MCAEIDVSALDEATANKRNTSSSVSFFSLYLRICQSVSLSHLFYISGRASAEQQPVEIPFSLISSDRAQGTPGEPGQLASLLAVAAACLAPGPEFGLPHHLITLEPWIYRAVHFYVCCKCHSLAWYYSTCTSYYSAMFYKITAPLQNAFLFCVFTEAFWANSHLSPKEQPPWTKMECAFKLFWPY